MSSLNFDLAAAKALEITYQTPDIIQQRAKVLDLLAPRPGERILDVGVGPGLLAYDLARLVGREGHVVGIDISAPMVEMAAARLAELSATCRVGDAAALDLPDQSFDAAVSTQVYEYVPDVAKALAELHRVLKPGGRALVLDTDWRSIVWHSGDPGLMERVLTCWDAHLADPHLPAKLGPLLARAGFTVRRVEIVPMLAPTWQPAGYAAGIRGTIRAFVRRHGAAYGLSEAEIAAWHADQDRLIADGAFFFSVNRYAFVATR